jgi:hypothetical protein
MIAHQAIGMDLPIRLLASLGQRLKQVLAVHIIDEDVLLAVATIHHVVDRARILHSHRPRHVQQNVDIPSPRQAPKRIPFRPQPQFDLGTNLRFDPFPFPDVEDFPHACAKSNNALLSRSRRRLSSDETWEQRIFQHFRKRKGWRLSAPAKS